MDALIAAGINDWGGVSPITPDHVNPESPWPHLQQLAEETATSGKQLLERLTIYPDYIEHREDWLDHNLHKPVLSLADADGLARDTAWAAGSVTTPPPVRQRIPMSVGDSGWLDKALSGEGFSETDIVAMFSG